MSPTTEADIEKSAPAKRKPGCLGWLARGAAGLILLLIALTVAGIIFQSLGERQGAREFPAPGRVEDVGGRRLHLYCTGESVAGRPTVILETLSGGLSPYWAWVQEELAGAARVCSYDRAGRGWSDPAATPPTLKSSAGDLHSLLSTAGVAPPYVLAGHSIGGLYVRQFAADYPDEVAGVVLVDSSHPNQFERYPELSAEFDSFARIAAFFPALARIGLFRLYFNAGGQMDLAGLPAQAFNESAVFLSNPAHWTSVLNEMDAIPQVYRDGQALGELGDMPLAVVTAGRNPATGWPDLQADLARLSSNSLHVTVDEATHGSLAFDQAHAAQTSAAILAVIEAAATGQSLADGN